MKVISTPARLGVALVLAPLVLVLTSGPALAADVVINNTETVQAHLNPDGSVIDARVYEQIALQGSGTVVITNPVSTDNLRNLDGFSSFLVTDNSIVTRQTVDGQQRLRTVSDYTKKLPLQVSVTYQLNGKTVEAGDVVGKSGHLEVHYKVTNVTGRDQNVTYDDGTGKMVTQTANVVIPMVGTLTTVLPSNFVDVTSGEASIAGDGRGQTKMTYTMTLFGPIGSPTSEFGYSANISNGLIPDASISALPVNPLASPSFKGGAASYKSGAASGVQLTAGATQIDANVLKLRDGAQTLIAGLILLRDGAQKLNVGLAGTAAPGAVKLADGATQLNSGAGQLATGTATATNGAGVLAAGSDTLAAGAGKVNAGAGELSTGLSQASGKAPALLVGLAQVTDGLKKVDSGLAELYGGIGELPAKAQPIHTGIQSMLQGIGTVTTQGTLLYGVNAVRAGLADATAPGGPVDLLKGGVDLVNAGLATVVATLGDPTTLGQTVRYGVHQVKLGLDAGLTAGGIQALIDAVGVAAATPGCSGDSTCTAELAGVSAGLVSLKAQTQTGSTTLGQVEVGLTGITNGLTGVGVPVPPGGAIPGLDQVSAGLTTLKTQLDSHPPGTFGPSDPGGAGYALSLVQCGLSNTTLPVCDLATPGLVQGLDLVDAGVSTLVSGVVSQVQGAVGTSTDVYPAQNTLRGGVHAVQGGVDLIGAGGLALLDGLNKLNVGAGTLAAGTSVLDAGAQKLASGAGQLYTGMGQLSSGATKLSDGTAQLSDGANKLATGLGDAASGSEQLAGGLITASDSGKALPAGATKLSAEGTSKLVESGQSTASDYGLKYATIVAGAERANTDAMAYGAPANASGATAYALEIAGVGGDSSGNLGRGLAGLALFAVGAGLIVYRRMAA